MVFKVSGTINLLTKMLALLISGSVPTTDRCLVPSYPVKECTSWFGVITLTDW